MKLDATVRQLKDWSKDDAINGRSAATRGLSIALDADYRTRKLEDAQAELCHRLEVLEAQGTPPGQKPKLPSLQLVQDHVADLRGHVQENLKKLEGRSNDLDARLRALETIAEGN